MEISHIDVRFLLRNMHKKQFVHYHTFLDEIILTYFAKYINISRNKDAFENKKPHRPGVLPFWPMGFVNIT